MPDISKTEFEVLEALWEKHPASANEIIEHLNKTKEWHEKTVKTLLSRLVKKKALAYEKDQRRYLYYPLIERDSYMAKESKNLIERVFSGRVSPLVAGFAKHNQLAKDDIDELKKIISQWEQDND
ncbi:BlaI/MecI/CopY family transcriptional regulator [Thalassotalea piscium]|uniref:Putative transcriptional regulator n=1 Tax=Thalassotalea piscium TaxID=1230533 RepID=A0A7X0NK80_9GAMM|nr:BlaI/MecI/CopY family transcriptional regulator [Thalassotalea piscium]MBB6544836.1 putative transcriptional regulator [Thalassotalea piscium]